jgi:hypothetical protein
VDVISRDVHPEEVRPETDICAGSDSVDGTVVVGQHRIAVLEQVLLRVRAALYNLIDSEATGITTPRSHRVLCPQDEYHAVRHLKSQVGQARKEKISDNWVLILM